MNDDHEPPRCIDCGGTEDVGFLKTDDGPVPLCYACFLEGLDKAIKERTLRN